MALASIALAPVDVEGVAAGYVGLARQLATFLAVAALIYALGRWLAMPAVTRAIGRTKLNHTARESLGGVLHVAVVVAAFLAGSGAAGFTRLFAGSALLVTALGLAVGFAAQDALANFVSGVFIVGDPKLNVGDQIRWDGNEGRITAIRFRVTHVRTGDNETVIVPNNQLATSSVTNETGNDPIGVSAEFGVGYGDDLGAVEDAIRAAAADVDATLDDREPTVRLARLDDNAVVVMARIWIAKTDRRRRADVRAAFVGAAADRLADAGVDLSTTSQHALSGDLDVAVMER